MHRVNFVAVRAIFTQGMVEDLFDDASTFD
jgi:hypothetical protein